MASSGPGCGTPFRAAGVGAPLRLGGGVGGAPTLPAAVVDAQAPGDRRYPRPEGPGGGVALPGRPRSKERLLSERFSIGPCDELPATEGDERAEMRAVQLRESRLPLVRPARRTIFRIPHDT